MNKKVAAILATVGCSITFSQLNFNEQSIKHPKVHKEKINPIIPIQNKEIEIFTEKEITTDQLNNLLTYSEQKRKLIINENEIEKTLIPFVKEKLKTIFLRKG